MARECGAPPDPPDPPRITGGCPSFYRLGGIARGGRSDDSRHQGRKFVFVNVPALDDLDAFGVGLDVFGIGLEALATRAGRFSRGIGWKISGAAILRTSDTIRKISGAAA